MPRIDPHDFSSFVDHHAPLYKGRRIDVYEMEVEGKQGTAHMYDWVRHPGAVVVLPFLDKERIILIENQRAAVGKTLLELPAGTLEQGESPAVTAEREMEEETGYRASSMTHLFDFYSSPGFCNEVLFAFSASELTFFGQRLDPTENIQTVIVPFPEAVQWIREGKIQDAKTIATLLYYATFGRSQ